MDPIPVIELNEYDLSYELQFTTFMITLLEPYIRFVRKSEAPEIYRKGGKSPAGEERISVKEYVYFPMLLMLATAMKKKAALIQINVKAKILSLRHKVQTN